MDESFDRIVAVAALVATVAIPVLLWWAEKRSGEQLSRLQELQVEILASQERLERQRRRDAILDRADTTQNAALLRILWMEALQFDGDDRRLLQATFRNNGAVALPGAHNGVDLPDVLDAEAIHDYVQSVETRYAGPGYRFDGLLPFLKKVRLGRVQLASNDVAVLGSVLTGDCAVSQNLDHWWYLDLVKAAPALAPALLAKIDRLPEDNGPLRMNALSGVLEGILAIRDREILMTEGDLQAVRYEVAQQLAMKLGHDLGNLDIGYRHRQVRSTTATAAMLIEVVGWAAGAYDHLGNLMMGSLPQVMGSIPERARPWGVEASQVRAGFAVMQDTWPELWVVNGKRLEAAADAIGQWRGRDDASMTSTGH